MRKVFCCILLLIVALVLSGCECEHQWTDADCVNSQFCSLCQETGQDALGHDYAAATCTEPETCTRCFKTRGEVLGHDYAPATCTEPETCTRCAATSGEALGHAFADWYFYEPLMSHTCETCGLCRTAPIDRELYLGTLLAGHWDVITFTYDEQTYTMNDYAKVDFGYAEMGCTFTEDKTLQFTGPNGLVMKGTWRLDECILEDGAVLYSLKITFTQIPNEVSAESTALMFLFDAKDQEDSLYFVVGDIWVELSKNSRYVSEVVGNWGIGDNGWGIRTGNCAFWLSFQPDRTVTGYMDGPIEGTWHLEPLGNNCGIYVKYEKDEETEWLQLLFFPGKEDTGPTLCPLDAKWVKFIKVSEAELDVIKLPTEVFASTWKIQSYMSSDNKQVPVDEQTKVIITKSNDVTIAFKVDEVREIIECDNAKLTDFPSIARSQDTAYVDRVANHNGRLILLLDQDKLLKESEAEAISQLVSNS